MLRGCTFENQNVTSKNDGGLYSSILEDGILWGCGMSATSTALTIQPGEMIAGGRVIYVDGATTVTAENAINNGYGQLVLSIDLSKTATGDAFEQLEIGFVYSTTATFPELTKEDINSTGTLYECEIAVVKIEGGNITGIVSSLTMAKVNLGEGVLPPLSENITLYVASTGSDEGGNGTEQLPYATIQKALNSLPKNLNGHTATVKLSAGTYGGFTLTGFFGGEIGIEGGTDSGAAASYVITGQIRLYNSHYIVLSGLKFTAQVLIIRGNYDFSGCVFNGAAESGGIAIYIQMGAHARITDCDISNNAGYAVTSILGASIDVLNCTGSGNSGTLYRAGTTSYTGGTIHLGANTVTTSGTMYQAIASGRIYYGTQASVPSY